MNAVLSLVAVVTLLVVGTGVGLLLLVPCGRGRELGIGAAATCLVGLCALCALLPNLFLLGVPRAAVLAVAYLAAAAGWVLALRRRRAVHGGRRSVAIAVLFALALEAPMALAATMPPLANDAVAIWWPKVVEVAHGRWPDLHGNSLAHASPFYPRGMAWLASVALPASNGEGPLVRAIPLLWTWLTALAMTAAVRAHGRPREALLVGLVFLLLPDVAQCAHSGTPDVAIAAAVLLVGLGLSARCDHREGYAIAAAAACGAASIKEEGNLVLFVVVATFALDALRQPARRRAAVAGIAAAAVLLPFALVRASVPQTRLDTVSVLLANPDMLCLRAAAVVEQVVAALVAPGSLPSGLEEPVPLRPLWSAWIALGSLAVLAWPLRPRAIAVRSALVLLVGAGFVYVLSSAYVTWHVRTTLPRLSVEVMPLLLVAATVRWCAAGQRNEPEAGVAGTGMSPAGRWSAAHGD